MADVDGRRQDAGAGEPEGDCDRARGQEYEPEPDSEPALTPGQDPAPVPAPTPLGGCGDSLPMLSITRHFDFGQFVLVHSETEGDAGGQPPEKVVVDPTGGKYGAYRSWLEQFRRRDLVKIGPRPPERDRGPLRDPLGGVSLFQLVDSRGPTAWAPLEIPVASEELADVIRKGRIPYGNRSVALQLDEEAVASLAAGRETLVMAGPRDEATRPFLTKLVVQVPTVRLDEEAVDQVLAEGRIVDGEVERPLAIAEEVTRALLDGRPVVAWTSERSPRLVRLEPPGEGRRATAAEVVVRDLAGFLSQPLVPGSDGRPVSVALSRSQVSALRLDGTATVNLGGDQITLIDGNREDQALRDGHRLAARALTERVSLADGVTPVRRIENRVTAALPSPRARSTDESRAVVPLGLPVAVFMPWRQVWQLTGFSRGELRGSLALAPQEETTVEVSSWERRLRTLEQSSQTEVDQSFESVQTQRDTDDVFAELTRRHDFAWQLEGSVDATYSTGNGSITVAAGGKVSDTSQLQSVARVTQQRMKESTLKFAARIRAIRTTRITDAVETGGQSRVTRLIKNTCVCRRSGGWCGFLRAGLRGRGGRSLVEVVGRDRVLKLAGQPYYRWLDQPVTDAVLKGAYRATALFEAHRDDPESGYRFPADEARGAGAGMADRTAWRICRDNRWWSVFGKTRGRIKKAGPPVHDDLVRRDFTADAPNPLWLADITEHATGEGKLYLCAIKDVFSRRIVGYSIDARMKSRLAVTAPNNAVARREHVDGCILHTDRGSQFRPRKFVRALDGHGMAGSIGRVGAASDNAAMWSFFSLL